MDSFALVEYASLAASRTFLQQLLACLNFTLDSQDLFCDLCSETGHFVLGLLETQ